LYNPPSNSLQEREYIETMDEQEQSEISPRIGRIPPKRGEIKRQMWRSVGNAALFLVRLQFSADSTRGIVPTTGSIRKCLQTTYSGQKAMKILQPSLSMAAKKSLSFSGTCSTGECMTFSCRYTQK
jgi:hypothetical protein